MANWTEIEGGLLNLDLLVLVEPIYNAAEERYDVVGTTPHGWKMIVTHVVADTPAAAKVCVSYWLADHIGTAST